MNRDPARHDARIVALWKADVPTKEICRQLRLGYDSLRRRAKVLRLERRGLVPNGWSEAEIETIKRLWPEGKSATEIAHTLQGRSKNGVIGMAHRLGLSNTRAKPAKPAKPARAPKVARTHFHPPKPGPQNRPAVAFGILSQSASTATAQTRKERAAEGRAAIARSNAAAVESPNAKPWMERVFGECPYPLGDKGDIRSCCNPVGGGTAMQARYCPAHYAVMAPEGPTDNPDRRPNHFTRHDRIDAAPRADDVQPLDLALAA